MMQYGVEDPGTRDFWHVPQVDFLLRIEVCPLGLRAVITFINITMAYGFLSIINEKTPLRSIPSTLRSE
jgi:hypothetical protein